MVLLCFNIKGVFATENNILDTQTIEMPNTTTNITVHENPAYINLQNNHSSHIKISTKDRLYDDTPKISMWAKPSCGCRYSYIWHKKTFIDYCPHCKHYNVLCKNPKGVPEREYTCGRCGADYCGCCGKEKYSWSRYYLTQC